MLSKLSNLSKWNLLPIRKVDRVSYGMGDSRSTGKWKEARSTVHTSYEAISGLTLSSANYQEAIDVLHKRFGDKQLITSKHMEILLSIKAVISEQNVRGLRRLDDVKSHIRGLKSLGESYGVTGTLE